MQRRSLYLAPRAASGQGLACGASLGPLPPWDSRSLLSLLKSDLALGDTQELGGSGFKRGSEDTFNPVVAPVG